MADPRVAAADHRSLPRRRGDALRTAVLEATLAELRECGYANLTMEQVARRAGTGKASVYRRWPSRLELVLDAVHHAMPEPASPPSTGTLRGDLIALLRATADQLAGPTGEALRGVVTDALREQHRIRELRGRSQGPGRAAMREITRRAVQRGEIDARAVTPRRLEVAQAMLRQQFLFEGVPIPHRVLVEMVDDVLVPLFSTLPRPPGG